MIFRTYWNTYFLYVRFVVQNRPRCRTIRLYSPGLFVLGYGAASCGAAYDYRMRIVKIFIVKDGVVPIGKSHGYISNNCYAIIPSAKLNDSFKFSVSSARGSVVAH